MARVRRIIDGNCRKRIADEFGYDCPEVVHSDLDEDEKRTLARALNLARRQLNREQKRELIADQLCESPDRSNRWVAKQLGVHHATVSSVRALLEANRQIEPSSKRLGSDGKVQPASKSNRPVLRTTKEQQARIDATILSHGDCRDELPKLPSNSVDAVITDPIYPEIDREHGTITEAEWHELIRQVVSECRRVLKPSGSAVFILQPNYEQVGQMRLWLVKMCVWLGPKHCFRNQEAVLNTPSQRTSDRSASDERFVLGHNEKNCRLGKMAGAAAERGGTTPFNLMPISNGGQPRGDHPSTTPQQLADLWCRYILPENGVLLDCFVGSGGMLAAGLDHRASTVLGIEKEGRAIRRDGVEEDSTGLRSSRCLVGHCGTTNCEEVFAKVASSPLPPR